MCLEKAFGNKGFFPYFAVKKASADPVFPPWKRAFDSEK